jgi:hypothetical protein
MAAAVAANSRQFLELLQAWFVETERVTTEEFTGDELSARRQLPLARLEDAVGFRP